MSTSWTTWALTAEAERHPLPHGEPGPFVPIRPWNLGSSRAGGRRVPRTARKRTGPELQNRGEPSRRRTGPGLWTSLHDRHRCRPRGKRVRRRWRGKTAPGEMIVPLEAPSRWSRRPGTFRGDRRGPRGPSPGMDGRGACGQASRRACSAPPRGFPDVRLDPGGGREASVLLPRLGGEAALELTNILVGGGEGRPQEVVLAADLNILDLILAPLADSESGRSNAIALAHALGEGRSRLESPGRRSRLGGRVTRWRSVRGGRRPFTSGPIPDRRGRSRHLSGSASGWEASPG